MGALTDRNRRCGDSRYGGVLRIGGVPIGDR